MRFKDALQYLPAKVEEPSIFEKWPKKRDRLQFRNALQNLLAEVDNPVIALKRAARRLDRLQFKDALQNLLAEVDNPVIVRQWFAKRFGDSEAKDALEGTIQEWAAQELTHLQFKDALRYLLAEVDKPVTAPQRAVKLPDLLGFNDGDPNTPYSQRKGSATGDTKRYKVLKRGLSGTIDGLKVSALADTGAAQNVISSNFAIARNLDVVGSPSSFRLGNSKLAHSSGRSTNRLEITK